MIYPDLKSQMRIHVHCCTISAFDYMRAAIPAFVLLVIDSLIHFNSIRHHSQIPGKDSNDLRRSDSSDSTNPPGGIEKLEDLEEIHEDFDDDWLPSSSFGDEIIDEHRLLSSEVREVLQLYILCLKLVMPLIIYSNEIFVSFP